MKNPIIETEKLCKSYAADGVQTHVLSNVDLTLYEGDFTAVMGPSGSGKSTLLYCLSGMDALTAGKVRYRGASIPCASATWPSCARSVSASCFSRRTS